MAVQFGPALLPPRRKAHEVLHGGGIGENACLLVVALVKPFYLDHRQLALQGTRKTATAVVALDRCHPRPRVAQHIGHESFGDLHRLTRIDRVGDVNQAVGIDRIAERAEVVVAHIGRVGVGGVAHHLARQPLVGHEIAIEQPFAR